MLDRLISIGKKIEDKLKDEKYVATLLAHQKNKNFEKVKNLISLIVAPNSPRYTPGYYDMDALRIEFEKENIEAEGQPFDLYFRLLHCACVCNMREELDELFGLKKYEIDRLAGVHRPDQPESLLGTASFHGHLDLVTYLVDVKKASVNAVANIYGGRALHQVVCGDSFPLHKDSFGTQHAEVAQYLIDHRADLTLENHFSETALVQANKYAPSMLGRLFRRDRDVRPPYFADKVRPVIVAALELKNNPQKNLETENQMEKTSSLSI